MALLCLAIEDKEQGSLKFRVNCLEAGGYGETLIYSDARCLVEHGLAAVLSWRFDLACLFKPHECALPS